MKSSNLIHLVVVAIGLTEIPVFATTSMSIEEAAKKGLIKLHIKSKGGFTGNVIEMKIFNNTDQTLALKLEAGRKLDSKVDQYQDILVTQAQEMFVSAKQQKIFNVNGMCCQAHNSCPAKEQLYKVGSMADSNLIKVAKFIDKNKFYTNFTAQQAVWVVSNDNSLGSISGGGKEEVNMVRDYISKITGKVIPPYEIIYGNGTGSDLLGKIVKVEGVFPYHLARNAHASIGIYNEEGRIVQILFEDLTHEKGDYKLYYTFNTRNLPSGTYHAIFRMDGAVERQEKIVI